MKKRKKWSLIIAMCLSLAIFMTNMSGLTMVVRADDVQLGATVEEPVGTPAPETVTDTPTVVVPDPVEDPTPVVDTTPTVSQAELDAQKAKAEAEAQAAKEAEEAAKAKKEADEAAAAAAAAAEEQAKRMQQEAEDAANAARAQQEAASSTSYKLNASNSKINFGSVAVGQVEQEELWITNAGKTAVDLVSTMSGGDGVFSCTLHADKSHLESGESALYYVSMVPKTTTGTYQAAITFADATKGTTGSVKVTLTGKVTAGSTATKVSIAPSTVTLALGDSYSFSAVSSGTGDVSGDTYVWSVQNNKSTGTKIDQNGTLTVAADERANKLTVKATSQSNTKATGVATVSLQSNSVNVSATADPAAGGIVTGGGAVSKGGSVTLSAVPNKNYAFVGWVRDGKVVATTTNYTVSDVQSNVNVTAKFQQNYVTVTATANIAAAGTVTGGGNVLYGGKTTLSAKANNGYVFTGWKEGNNVLSTAASLELNNLQASRNIVAVFAKTSHTITLAASPAEGGTVSGGGTFPLNQGTTVAAKPNTGWAFQGWAVNGQIVSRDASVKIDKVDQDYSFTAVFVQTGVTTFTISAGVATTGGTISPSGKSVVAQGSNVTYTITPKSGYAILAVAVDNAQVGPVTTYTFTNVQGPHTIAAAFVLTDAGKAAAQASGKTTQTEKVQKIAKTEANTATETTTVSLEEAASGEGGDEFVEEMDLDNVTIPTDEELDIYDYTDVEADNPVLRELGVSFDEAKAMIASGDTMPILDTAFYVGSLDAYVENTLAPAAKEVDYQGLSMEELVLVHDDINPSLPNLDVVVQKLLTSGEITEIADGGAANITVSLTGLDSSMVAPVDEKIMKNAVGQKPLHYFDLTMMKTVDGYSENVTELPEAMEVVVEVPDAIYKSGKTYSILRVHDGDVSILPDLDDDPKTITFRTDRFSTYAIAEQQASTRQIMVRFAIGAAIALVVAVVCFVILMTHQAKVRKERRRARVEQLRRERNGR